MADADFSWEAPRDRFPPLGSETGSQKLSDEVLVGNARWFIVFRWVTIGALGDVAVITSVSTSIRANHYHDKDWHLSYVVSGSMRYLWKEELDSEIENSLIVKGGEMVYTKPGSPHKMIFLEESTFIAVSDS